MSICTFLASNYPLPEAAPEREYPIHIDIDKGTVFDGDADDNFFLRAFPDIDLYSGMRYGVTLEWVYYTRGRAERILACIRQVLEHTDSVELWLAWLGSFREYDERPRIHRYHASIGELTPEDIGEFTEKPIWNSREDLRPNFHCLNIRP